MLNIYHDFTILDSYISQGSVATYVKGGEKRDKGFIANFLLDIAVKEL